MYPGFFNSGANLIYSGFLAVSGAQFFGVLLISRRANPFARIAGSEIS